MDCSWQERVLASLALGPVQLLVLPQHPFHAETQIALLLSLWHMASSSINY